MLSLIIELHVAVLSIYGTWKLWRAILRGSDAMIMMACNADHGHFHGVPQTRCYCPCHASAIATTAQREKPSHRETARAAKERHAEHLRTGYSNAGCSLCNPIGTAMLPPFPIPPTAPHGDASK